MNGKRVLAWRNLMGAAIDVALERGLLDLDPGAEVEACVFHFKLDGFPTLAAISDSGYGEVTVRVAVLPTERGAELVRCFGSGFRAGDAYASGWLERRPDSARLQTPRLSCRPWLLPLIAAAGR
jgi:hypothetical protein